MKRALLFLLCAVMSVQIFSTVDISAELFPTLAGLQRTHTIEMYDHAPNDGKRSGGYPLPFASVKDTVINGKTYLQFGDYVNGSNYSLFFLREENNKVLIYSSILQEDLVLYDYTLKLGDSLPAITSDHDYFSDDHFTKLDKAENIFTYVVTDVSTITLLDGIERKKWILKNKYLPIIEYVEGIGCYGENTSHSGDFFGLIYDHPYTTEYVGDHLVCVSKNGQLLYSMSQEEMNSFTLTCECLSQEDTIAPKDLFPTLWGLQQTICSGYYGEEGDEWASGLTGPSQEITMMDGKPYLQWGSWYLREENDKILVYSEIQKKDLVLYDFTLELGDTLTTLNLVTPEFLEYEGIVGIVDYPLSDYDYTYPIDTLVVTELSKETLLDGKEYTRWKFSDGTVYVEGIGSMSETFFHHIADHLPVPVSYLGSYLVCVSKNGKLLYQMDDAELERLNTECLCDGYQSSYKDQWCDQWNVLSHGYLGPDEPLYNAHTIIHSLKGDTIINDLVYQKLVGHLAISPPTPNVYIGAMRFAEDKKVFVYYDNNEYLLYDFNVQIGDTLNIFGGIEYYIDNKTLPHIVVNIDTLDDGRIKIISDAIIQEEINGIIHEEKRQKIWIEGIGSLDGIVYNTATTMYGSGKKVLLCAYHNNDCCYTTDYTSYASLGCVYNDSFFTATEEVNSYAPSAHKIISNGQLLILRDGKTYNVMGVEVGK